MSSKVHLLSGTKSDVMTNDRDQRLAT